MAPASSIATQNAAKHTILEADIQDITDVEYSGEDARKWKQYIAAATKNVPSKTGGPAGAHGHTYLIETNVQFHTRSSVNPAPAVNPGRLVFSINVTTEL